jgi:hypothetical protein
MDFKQLAQRLRDFSSNIIDGFTNPSTRHQAFKIISFTLGSTFLLLLILMLWWDNAPSQFDPAQNAQDIANRNQHKLVTGYTSTATLITLTDALLNKSGGYLSNDVMPPSIWMDNIPNWEFGVLVQIRDFSRALRNDISQFYARADNLAEWLAIVEKRLGSLSQRLSASVGQTRINTDLAGEPAAIQSTPAPAEIIIKTPWTQIDDIFYETRGTSWALIHLLKAVEHDFADILIKKNALVSLRQIIRELEATQEAIWSPVILNGSGFGFMANHSLVMASYISRANAAIIDLRSLLSQG